MLKSEACRHGYLRKKTAFLRRISLMPQAKEQPVFFTPKGLEEVKSRLKFLKTIKLLAVTERIVMAKEFGGTSENSEYLAALEEQQMVENRIVYLEKILKNAKIIPVAKNHQIVGVGARVKLEIDNQLADFTIVGKAEADPAQGFISNESPLGQALLGKKNGEVVKVEAPMYHYHCRIVAIK